MGAKTDFLENACIDHLFRGTPFNAPATLYVALFTASPGEAGGGTEVTGGGYARVGVAASAVEWAAPVAGNATTSNNNAITFPAPTAAWGSVVAWGIFDAAVGGNLLVYAPLTTPKTINAGDAAPSFAPGALTFQEDT